jgi:hypothetical protein
MVSSCEPHTLHCLCKGSIVLQVLLGIAIGGGVVDMLGMLGMML